MRKALRPTEKIRPTTAIANKDTNSAKLVDTEPEEENYHFVSLNYINLSPVTVFSLHTVSLHTNG